MAVVGLCGAHNLLHRLVALIEKGGVDLSTVQHLIIDEADRLFDDGCVLSLPNPACCTHSHRLMYRHSFVEQLDAIVCPSCSLPRLFPLTSDVC